MPPRKSASATMTRARSGTTAHYGASFVPLLTVGPYSAFWIGNAANGYLDILQMSANGLVSIKAANNCDDAWSFLNQLIPALPQFKNLIAGKPVSNSGGGAVGTTARTRASTATHATGVTRRSRRVPINSAAVGANT